MSERNARFRDLVLPHLDAAYNLARWLSRSQVDADDIVQEAMLRAFRGFETFRGTDAKPWLMVIVRNCHRTRRLQARPGRSVPLDDAPQELAAPEPGPESEAVLRSDMRKLDAVIAGLPEEFREVLILREIDELSYREIAQIVGCPAGTVMSRLARGRALLRQRWLGEEQGHGT